MLLDRNVRRVCGRSSSLLLSKGERLAVAGVRKELYIWSLDTQQLVKVIDAHFQRIIDIKPLIHGMDNSVITSSIDRSIKVWNLDHIFEFSHPIEKHEIPIEAITVSTESKTAVTVTRNYIGVWNYMTGKLKFTLGKASLGAIITIAIITENGRFLATAESDELGTGLFH